MAHLVCNTANPRHLYKRDGHLVRTPIKIRLQPDEKKIYQIGDQRTADQLGYLHSGFRITYTDEYYVKQAGSLLVNQMINGTPRWFDASGPHKPEFVWYQGAYATSTRYIYQGEQMSEAYAQLAGYHFTVPQNLQGRYDSVQVNFVNMGAVWAYGQSKGQNPNNTNIKNALYGWTTGDWYVPFHFLNTPTCNYHQTYINSNFPYDSVNVSQYGSTGDFKGYHDLWEISNEQATDGCLPTLTNPVTQSYNLGTTTLAGFKSNSGGWILPSIHPQYNSADDYKPSSGWGGDGSNHYWACLSLWDITVDLVIE